MIWVVIANTYNCHIYEYEGKPKKLTLAKKMVHPESRLKGIDLTSSAPGRYNTGGAARGAYSPHEEPKEVEVVNFSREIAKELDAGRRENLYKNIVLIALPHMNGLIHLHLNEHVGKSIIGDIKKDYCHLTENELLDVLKKELHHF